MKHKQSNSPFSVAGRVNHSPSVRRSILRRWLTRPGLIVVPASMSSSNRITKSIAVSMLICGITTSAEGRSTLKLAAMLTLLLERPI